MEECIRGGRSLRGRCHYVACAKSRAEITKKTKLFQAWFLVRWTHSESSGLNTASVFAKRQQNVYIYWHHGDKEAVVLTRRQIISLYYYKFTVLKYSTISCVTCEMFCSTFYWKINKKHVQCNVTLKTTLRLNEPHADICASAVHGAAVRRLKVLPPSECWLILVTKWFSLFPFWK